MCARMTGKKALFWKFQRYLAPSQHYQSAAGKRFNSILINERETMHGACSERVALVFFNITAYGLSRLKSFAAAHKKRFLSDFFSNDTKWHFHFHI